MPPSKDEGEEEENDEFAFDEQQAAAQDKARLQRVLSTNEPSTPGPESLGNKPKQQAARRTSLLHLMLGGVVSKTPTKPPQSPKSPGKKASLEEMTKRDTNLSVHSTRSRGGSRGSLGSHRSAADVVRGITQAVHSVVDRRMSMMNRVRMSGAGHMSMDVDALMQERRARPFSAPAPRGATKGLAKPKDSGHIGWEERWTLDDMPYYYDAKTEAVSWEKPDELKTAEELEHEQGEWTWVPSPHIVWQGARIAKKLPNGDVLCKTLAGSKQIVVPASGFMRDANTNGLEMKVPLWPLSKSSLYLLEDDLVALDDPNEALILHNLRARYAENTIYTWVGASRSVLVSVNPFKQLKGLYSRETIELQADKSPNRPPPAHVFGIAADALESLLWDNDDNSILISGESGAGKTEATKHVLKFLASVAGSKSHVEQRVLEANPILEAFGNAQTLRNKNSSRFGKWIEVNFDSKSRQISGASITSYLLERSRVIYQQKGERNFHIFYQLCSSDQFRAQYGLGELESFRYLNQSETFFIDGVDDAQELSIVIRSMAEMGFLPDEQEWILRMACAVLHLGNIDFVPNTDVKLPQGSKNGGDTKGLVGSQVSNKSRSAAQNGRAKKPKPAKSGGNRRASTMSLRLPSNFDQPDTGKMHLQEAAKLLGFAPDELERVLCFRSVKVKDETNVIPLNCDEARNGVDSFAMSIYARLFEWLVSRINEALGGGRGHFVGVLDIFGFEIFEKNSFEQLCINFANEKLQGQFNDSMFKEEEGIYSFEEIEYTKVPFSDNQLVLKLIEGKPDGLLPQLDDEVKAPGGSDERWASKMPKLHASNERFRVDGKSKIESAFNFQVLHYAGTVNYSAVGFVQANTETLFEDMHILGSHSKDKMTAVLFPLDQDGRPARFAAPSAATVRLAQSKSVHSKSVSGDNARGRGKSSAPAPQGAAQSNRALATTARGQRTVGQQFREQLNELMEVLAMTESRYVRCIKPNKTQSPDTFDSFLILEQLKYSGVFEAVAIRRQGFPFRCTHRQFVYQYQLINKKGTTYRCRMDDYSALAQEIMDNVPQRPFKDVRIGKTRVMYRAREHKLLMLLRNLALERLVPWMQSRLRGYIGRKLLKACRECDKLLQSAMDEENDIDSLEDALKECKDVMGEILPKMFPRAQPSKMKQATQMVEDLKKLVQLEEDLDALDNDSREVMQKYFEIKGTLHKIDALSPPLVLTRRQERLVEKMRETLESCAEGERERQFAELEEKAEHAMKSLDRDQMNRFLGEAAKEFADKTSRILQDVRKTLDMMNLVDEESTKGIACVDRVLMEKAMKDAASIKYKNPNINECQRLCALSEYQFCTLELEAAIKLKDEPRRIHREIRIQELNLDQTGSKYARFEEYRELRSPIEWANARGFFAKMLGTASAKLAMGMMKHSTKPIHLSLTKLEDAESAKKAVFLHKCLLAYGGDGAADAAEPDAAGTSFLSAGLQNKSLRDETYALLIKQLTENPSTMSQRNCEELLGLTLATYPPSAQLEPWVIMFMRAQFGDDPKRLKKFTSILHTSKYGPGVRAIKPIEELRRVFETHTQSRYSLQPLQNSGPTTTQE